MANKFHTYFGQIITDAELNEIFDALYASVDRFVQDFGFSGIAVGGDVTQHSPLNLSVDVGAPTSVYDQFANRMEFGSPVNVHVNVDENGAATAVTGSLNEKWLSIFIQFTSTPSDPRTDDLGNTVYFQDVTSYKLNVAQGAEAPVGTATRPALRGDQVLLADVKLAYGATTIANASIASDRTQVIFNVPGTPLALRGKSLADVLLQLVTGVNSALTTMSGDIAAINVDTLIAGALTGSPLAISSGSVHSVFAALLGGINDLYAQLGSIPGSPDLSHYLRDTGNNYVTQTDASIPLLATNNTPPDDAYFVGGAHNRWKLIFVFKHAGGQYVNVYTGQNVGDTAGAYAITVNSSWDIPSQKWKQENATLPSVAVVWFYGRVRVAGRAAGAADWSNWDQTTDGLLEIGKLSASGDVSAGGAVTANTVSTLGNVAAGANLTAIAGLLVGGGGSFGGGITITGECRYASAKARVTEVNLSRARPDGSNISEDSDFGFWVATSTGARLFVPIELPSGAVLNGIDILHNQSTAAADSIRLMVRHSDWSTIGDPPASDHLSADTIPASSGWQQDKVESALGSGLTIAADSRYTLVYEPAASGNVLGRVRLRWHDFGPQNF